MTTSFKHILLLVVAAVTAMAIAAPKQAKKFEVTKVDFDRVKQVTQNTESRFYWPNLLKLYRSNTDTTMVLDDYRNLYYGYIFQEDYNPYRVSQYSDKVEELYYRKDLSREECDSIQKYAELSVDDNIFDLEQMEYYIYALKKKRKHARAAVRTNKLDRLISAIMSSGKGTKEEPWVVICPQHEYNIVNFLGFVAIGHEETPEGLDHITVEKREGSKVEGFYFDPRFIIQAGKRLGLDE